LKRLHLVKKTDQLIVQNFDNLHKVIKDGFFRKFTIWKIPADFKALLYWMKHKPLKNGYLMRNYTALIPTKIGAEPSGGETRLPPPCSQTNFQGPTVSYPASQPII
jgi:hypothetical protein